MSPPLTPDEMEAVAAFLDQRRATAKKPAAPLRRGLVEEEIVPAHIQKQFTEAEWRTEDRTKGFESHVLRELQAIRQDMQPRATVELSDGRGGKSIQPASLVAAESSVRTESAAYKLDGKADAIQVAANRSDAQSLTAARWAKLGPVVTVLTSAALAGIWKFVEYLLHLP